MLRRTCAPIALACIMLLGACGGGGNTGSGSLESAASDDSGPENGASPFPTTRPPVDPASSVVEIQGRTQGLLVAYDDLMVEVFRQINDLYRAIESGMDSSSDPDTLERDAKLYDRIASGFCSTTRDTNGAIVSLSGCVAAPLAFRHPLYENVLISVDRYDLSTGYFDFTDIEIRHDSARSRRPRMLEICTDDGFCNGPSQTSEREEATYLDVSLDVPDGFIGEEDACLLRFEPFVFGEGLGSTNVNECAALMQDAMTVLQRLAVR